MLELEIAGSARERLAANLNLVFPDNASLCVKDRFQFCGSRKFHGSPEILTLAS
jgi:hypothetical protein